MIDQISMPLVLDACCGPRMFWFDSQDPRALFIDRRRETHELGRGRSPSVIAPDILADFTQMPFADESFYMVVFDPPHMRPGKAGRNGWQAKKYGVLAKNWQEQLRLGFAECSRVLKPNGTLVFKWADTNVPVSQVLLATPHKPLFGTRIGRRTHWYTFMKGSQKGKSDEHR